MKILTSRQFSTTFVSDNIVTILKCKAQVHDLGQGAYFSITADLVENGRLTACGCLHDMIEEYLPDLKPLIKWHLSSLESGPMHYIENALYWWDRSLILAVKSFINRDKISPIGEQALEYFKKTIVFGAVDSDASFDLEYKIDSQKSREKLDKEIIKKWLEDRLPQLMKNFKLELARFNLLP